MRLGGALVRKDIPPYVKAAKDPVSFIGINSIGLRRRGFSSEKISEIQNIYRKLFQTDNNITQALEIIDTDFPASKERDEITSFIRSSQRGVMKGYSSK